MTLAPAQRKLRACVAIAVVLILSALALRRYPAPIPNPLTLDLLVERPQVGKSEPLITTGRAEAGDFLFIRYLAEGFIAIGYEKWGEAGRLSPPLKLPPNQRVRLQIQMPALTRVRGVFAPPTDRLRIVANGVELLDAVVNYNVRLPAEIYFGANPIGGTTCDAALGGRLFLADGRDTAELSTFRDRFVGWIVVSGWQPLCTALVGLAVFAFWRRLPLAVRPATESVPDQPAAPQSRGGIRRHGWFVGTAGVATILFTWMVSYGSFDLVAPERFGDFYDYQAVSLLHGRLDVPDVAISGEAFIVNGKRYGYFGLTPALLRLPFVIFDLGFGQLSRAFMVLYFAGTLAACYLLLRAVNHLAGRGHAPPSAWATLCFVGGAGLGSTVFFLGSRAYIYHEAILCGVMFAVFACWCALRHYTEPDRRWWLGSLVCGVLSVHARPPTGFFALTLLGASALAIIAQRRSERPPLVGRQLLIGALCAFGVFTFNIVSYLKFGTFEGCPLRYNVQYDAKRLARIDGKQFHLVNLPITVDSYLVRPNFRFEAGFPYFFIGSRSSPRPWRETKIDYHDNTLGFPYAMPGLFALATLGGLATWAAFPGMRVMIVTAWAAGIPMSLAMFTAIAITHRYTADFCPFLFLLAALGAVGIEQLANLWRRLAKVFISAATVCAVLITLAITLHNQGQEVWGVPEGVRERYQQLRRRVDAHFGRSPP